jgi:hypothetical protein
MSKWFRAFLATVVGAIPACITAGLTDVNKGWLTVLAVAGVSLAHVAAQYIADSTASAPAATITTPPAAN